MVVYGSSTLMYKFGIGSILLCFCFVLMVEVKIWSVGRLMRVRGLGFGFGTWKLIKVGFTRAPKSTPQALNTEARGTLIAFCSILSPEKPVHTVLVSWVYGFGVWGLGV